MERFRESGRILVVDDEPDTLGLIELTLKTAGFQVEVAGSGEQALRLLQEDTFDLLLLDVMMPGLSGFELVEELRAAIGSIPPVIFLTAKSRKEDREMGERLEASAYLVKPTSRGQLLDAIRSALKESPSKDALD
jgi:DNA-binding response OmpR family regulator